MIVARAAPDRSPETGSDDQVPQMRASSVRAVITFLFLTFAWTWGLWWISALVKVQAPMVSTVLLLASAFGPGLAAVAVTLGVEGRTGLRRWVARCLKWRVGWYWYAGAVLAPPLIMFAALGIHAAMGGVRPASPISDHLLMAVAQVPLVAIFGGPLGEEFGWRGYALPALSARMGWRRASVIVGVAWAVWHLPLLFMAGTAQAELPLVMFLGSTVGLSVVFARLSVNTGFSVIPALVLHTVINWWSMAVPIMPEGGDTRAYSLVAGITVLVALAALWKSGPKPPDNPHMQGQASC